MTTKTSKLIAEIYILSTYNKETNTLEISKETIQKLNINENRKKLLKKIFNEIGINIEYPNKPLPNIQGIEYFEEYNQLKSKLETTTNKENIEIIEQRRIKLRNIIFESNMKLITSIINRRLKSSNIMLLTKNINIEDLYQLGYEILLNYLDKHYLEPNKLKREIQNLLILNIRRMIYTEYGICQKIGEKLLTLITILETNPNISTNLLSKELNIEEEQTKQLLVLANIINPIELYSLEECSIKQDISNTLEESFIEKQRLEHMLKLLDTIFEESQREVIKELCGFNGEKLTYQQLADKLGNTHGSIDGKRQRAIEHLEFIMRVKYLKEIMDIPLSKEESNIDFSKFTKQEQTKLIKLELFLLKELNQNQLDFITNNFEPYLKETLLIYLGYIQPSKSKYTKSNPSYITNRDLALEKTRKNIQTLYIQNNKNENLKNHIDYLMYNYLNKTKTKIKKKY